MGIIYSIIAIVALLSLYEYIAGKHWQQVTSSSRNEIVFEHRFKGYGAYVIRKDYDKRMVIILAVLIAMVGVTYGVFKYVQSIPEVEVKEEPMDLVQFTMDAQEEEEELPPPPPEEPIPPMEKTIAFVAPVVTDEDVVEEVTTQNEMKNTNAGETTQEGNDFAGPGETPPPAAPVEVKNDEPEAIVDEQAEFPGGVAALRQQIAERTKFPESAIEEGISGKVYIRFMVSVDGAISRVQVARGFEDCKECEQAVVQAIRSLPRFAKPAKKNGKEVPSWYTVPVSFSVQ